MTSGLIEELAQAVADEDFAKDPVGLLQSWAQVALGEVTPETRFWAVPASTPREALALQLAAEGPVTSRGLAEALGVSQERARQVLAGLASRGVLQAYGAGRGRKYTL